MSALIVDVGFVVKEEFVVDCPADAEYCFEAVIVEDAGSAAVVSVVITFSPEELTVTADWLTVGGALDRDDVVDNVVSDTGVPPVVIAVTPFELEDLVGGEIVDVAVAVEVVITLLSEVTVVKPFELKDSVLEIMVDDAVALVVVTDTPMGLDESTDSCVEDDTDVLSSTGVTLVAVTVTPLELGDSVEDDATDDAVVVGFVGRVALVFVTVAAVELEDSTGSDV